MPTAPPPPPEGLLDAVRQTASELLPARIQSTGHEGFAAEGGVGAMDVTAPRPLYHLGLEQLTSGRGLDAADVVGWRTLVTLGGRPVAASDVDVSGDAPVVNAMNYGPFVEGLARAGGAQEAAGSQAGGGGEADLEERVLQVPGVYFVGLWLHNDADPTQDTVIPASPAPPGLAADQAYRVQDVLRVLSGLAEQRLAIDDHARPEDYPPG